MTVREQYDEVYRVQRLRRRIVSQVDEPLQVLHSLNVVFAQAIDRVPLNIQLDARKSEESKVYDRFTGWANQQRYRDWKYGPIDIAVNLKRFNP